MVGYYLPLDRKFPPTKLNSERLVDNITKQTIDTLTVKVSAGQKYVPPEHTISLRSNLDDFSNSVNGTYLDDCWTFCFHVPDGLGQIELRLYNNDNTLNDNGSLIISIRGEMVNIPSSFVKFSYKVFVQTTQYRPNNTVSIKLDGDGDNLVLGSYHGDRWVFLLDQFLYGSDVKYHIIFNEIIFIPNSFSLSYTKPEVVFDESVFADCDKEDLSITRRFVHGYDNLYNCDSKFHQDVFSRSRRSEEWADVVIVGSGMGGGVLANELSKAGHHVQLIEAGSLLFPAHVSNLAFNWEELSDKYAVTNFENVPGSDLLGGTCMNLGGRSQFWWGMLIPLQDWEFQYWPDSVKEYLSAPAQPNGVTGYDRARRLLLRRTFLGTFQDELVGELQRHFPEFVIEDLPRSRDQPNGLVNKELFSDSFKSVGLFSTADLLLEALAYGGAARRQTLRVALNHLALRLETKGNSGVGVVCQDLVGHSEVIFRGRTLVLAAGSVESPKLALASQLLCPAGLIGKGLTDHVVVFSAEFPIPPSGRCGNPLTHAEVRLRHAQASERNYPFNMELWVNPAFLEMRSVDKENNAILPNVPTVRINFYLHSPLNEKNHISFSDSNSKVQIYVERNSFGKDQLPVILEVRNRLLEFFGINNYSRTWLDSEWQVFDQGTANHAGGSLRMGIDGRGVVDDNLRFKEYENIYCCDTSVYPHIPTANPSLTLVGLAQRLADHIEMVN